MPLDSTAKLSDIIEALQTMQGINSKADLASVIGSPATATDDMAKIIQDIQNSKNTLATNLSNVEQSSVGTETLSNLVSKVGNIVLGKKFASGIISTVAPSAYHTISGLDFIPKDIKWSGELSAGTPWDGIYLTLPDSTIYAGTRLNSSAFGTTSNIDQISLGTFRFKNPNGSYPMVNIQWEAYE